MTEEKKRFLSLHEEIVDTSQESGNDSSEIIVEHAGLLLEQFNAITTELDTTIFSQLFSLQQYGITNSLKNSPLHPPSKRLTPPPAQVSAAASAASATNSATAARSERKDPVKKSLDLIHGVSFAAKKEGKDLSKFHNEIQPLAKGYLSNILDELLPSIAEIVDKNIFSQRVTEKTKLLLEQSLKFAIAKKDGNLLLANTNDKGDQRLHVSHSLHALFQRLNGEFDGATAAEITEVINFFSAPSTSANVRDFTAKAMIVCEMLISENIQRLMS